MKRLRVLITIAAGALLIGAGVVYAANNTRSVYSFFTENYLGMKYNTPNPSDQDGAYMGFWGCDLNPATINIAAPPPSVGGDGVKAVQVVVPAGGSQGGVYMQFGYDGGSNPKVLTNMGAYQNGTFQFAIKANAECIVQIEDNLGTVTKLLNGNLGVRLDNTWQKVSIPLTTTVWAGQPGYPPIDFTKIKSIIIATTWATSMPSRTFCIDNVMWIKPNPTTTMTTQLKSISNGSAASQLTWTGVTPGTTKWKAADQYIELDMDYYDPSWGIQIYTDNKAADAAPRYVGGGNPAGLVGQYTGVPEASSSTLSMCWRIVDVATTTLNIQQGAAGFPNRLWEQTLKDTYPCFFWMKDKGTPDDPLTTTVNEAFIPGDDYVSVWDYRGIHHAEGDNWGPGCLPLNYIYVGADFRQAKTPELYQTSTLRVELFHE